MPKAACEPGGSSSEDIATSVSVGDTCDEYRRSQSSTISCSAGDGDNTCKQLARDGQVATGGQQQQDRFCQEQNREGPEETDAMLATMWRNKRSNKLNAPLIGQQPIKRPHFRIDWRKLTYYQKPGSLVHRYFFESTKLKSGDSSTSLPAPPVASAEKASDCSLDSGCHKQDGQLQGRKRILNSLDGCFKSGQLSAILGPSGAGKSTFLAALFGSKQEEAYGLTKVTYLDDQNRPLVGAKPQRPLRIAFLPQHDHLLHHLTVYETLLFASKIKNPEKRDNKQQGHQADGSKASSGLAFHQQNVKRIAKMLKITDCLDTRCGKLSGGQYKRVSIGQELLSEPDVIILDEPTSGLDAMTCLTTIQTLKAIVTRQPISIILTIHQPDNEVFRMFDHVYVIAQGGMAIYEGPPENILATMDSVNLKASTRDQNPARFIVEHAFIDESCLQPDEEVASALKGAAGVVAPLEDDEDDQDSSDDDDTVIDDKNKSQNFFKRSVLSLTDAISGKEIPSPIKKDKRPLLNIGIQTLDGKLITSDLLAISETVRKQKLEQEKKLNILKRLNEIQKYKYSHEYGGNIDLSNDDFKKKPFSERLSGHELVDAKSASSSSSSSSSSSGYSHSSGWSSDRKAENENKRATSLANLSGGACCNQQQPTMSASYSCDLAQEDSKKATVSSANNHNKQAVTPVTVTISDVSGGKFASMSPNYSPNSQSESRSTSFYGQAANQNQNSSVGHQDVKQRLRRQFDKRLSSKQTYAKLRNYPVWYHTGLLTHRTWLSIIRDPVFFGIQALMHTTIPLLLAFIFGSKQEEGCPRVGSFDLVEFAYSDTNMITDTVISIRQSVGNVGIVFFEMFVLSFSINCITALVFPADMFVLLKEYRNGWYSLRSYFFARTLADLPIPLALHSLAMLILYYFTGQPCTPARLGAVIVLVILASLVAQSVGLTVGAILMKSSQSAVLLAAGIVAPFFALSGFIVRIHTLPFVAQVAAKCSYLYHLLNGFIIIRYGFNRCPCRPEDFDANESHEIPKNLHTLASMWIGTYSDEYSATNSVAPLSSSSGNGTLQAAATSLVKANRTNVDPNIDVVSKMMSAFRSANSFGHQIKTCDDALPYAMLDFDLRDHDVYMCFVAIIIMLIVSRLITFSAIYYKVRTYA